MRSLLILVLISSACAQKPLTPEQCLQVRTLSGLEFSPDGQRLVFEVREPVKGTTDAQHLWVFQVGSNDLRQWTSSAKSERRPHWSPDSRSLAFLSNRDDKTQIYVMRADGGESIKLTDGKNDVTDFVWSPDSQQIAFLAGEPKTEAEEKKITDKNDARVVDRDDKPARLWVIDLASRKPRQVTKAPWRIEQVAWSADAVIVKASDRPEVEQWIDQIYRVTLADGTITPLAKQAGPFGSLQMSRDGTQVAYVASRGDGPSPHDLYSVPMAGGAAKNLTAASLDRPVQQYIWGPGSAIDLLVQNGFRSELYTLRDGAVKRLLPDFEPSITSMAVSDQGTIALAAGSHNQLPELWISDGKAARRVSKFNTSWGEIALRPIEIIQYASFDRKKIEAAVFRPSPVTGAKRAGVVLVHGGPTGAWSDRFDRWAQLLVARGYVVISPNIRGSSGYGSAFIESNRKDWGGGDFKDVMAAADWLVTNANVDPERIGIGGWSYGGYMSMWAITQTNRFHAAVAGAGLSDLAGEYGTEQGPEYDEWFYGLPYENLEVFQKSSPITYVKNAKTPTLILQGEQDSTDPPAQSQQLYRGLKRYGVITELVMYPREPHSFREEKHQLDLLERMLAWFDRFLKP